MGHSIQLALQNSMHRLVVLLALFVPGLLAFLLAVIALTLIGALFAGVVRRILTSIRFDQRLAARQTPGSLTNISEWSPSNSPTHLLSRAVLWICLIAGVAIGISAFDAFNPGTARLSMFFLPYVTHFAGASLILVIGTLLSRFLSRSVLIGAVNLQLQYARFLALGIKWLVLVLTAAMALDHLQIGGGIVELAFGILFGGIVLTLSLAIGLGSRDLVSRSIERNIDRPPVHVPDEAISQPPAEHHPPLRHF